MISWNHIDAYANDHDLAVSDLSHALFYGELGLFLGAGISRDFGLPGWPKLVQNCLTELGKDPSSVSDNATFDDLTRAAGKIKDHFSDDRAYLELIKNQLYKGSTDRDHAHPSPLLTAIGALLMGSRRGRIRDVWTLNYDDVLEWYLRIHGFISQVVTRFPCLLRDVDVTTYHPHGFLPLDDEHFTPSTEIVFDDRSYARRSVGKAQEWRDALQTALKSKIFIAIGMSWTDRLLRDLIIEASDTNKDRPTAFWLFGPNTLDADLEDCARHNVVPVKFNNHSEYAPFLLRICRSAMHYVEK